MSKFKQFTLAFFMFSVMTLSLISTNAIAANYTVTTGEEIDFMLYNSDMSTVYYAPQEQGTTDFTSWHSTLAAFDKVAAMSFYYRDTSIPNDPWHWWRNAAVGYLWPKVAQSLYSGSDTIEYKFTFQQWTTPLMVIHVEIE